MNSWPEWDSLLDREGSSESCVCNLEHDCVRFKSHYPHYFSIGVKGSDILHMLAVDQRCLMKRLLLATVLLASPTLFAQSPFDGTWTSKLDRAKYSLTCTRDAFSAESPLGERYTAKFDNNFYPIEGDAEHTMISAKLIDARTVELTSQRNGVVVVISRLSVARDGNSIHGTLEGKESGTKSAFDFKKQQ